VPQWLNGLNRKMAIWLWWVVLVGVIASLPVMAARAQTEGSADRVALVIDYRDLLQIGAGQVDPEDYVARQLDRLMQAGVNGAVVYESTLDELGLAGEVAVYSAAEIASMQGQTPPTGANRNRTYIVFQKPAHEAEIRRIVTEGFEAHGATIANWQMDGKNGLVIDMGKDDAMLRPFEPNPIKIQALREAGLWVVPRLSDRYSPYPEEMIDSWIKRFKAAGIDRISFDGNAVPGFSKPSPGPGEPSGVQRFAYMLENNGIGIAMFEGLKVPVDGQSQLAKFIDYNAIRAHSITDQEMANIKKDVLADRILLAVKDRDIRLVFLNAIPSRDAAKGKLSSPLNTIIDALQGVKDQSEEDGAGSTGGQASESDTGSTEGGAVAQLQQFGFEIGVPQAFEVHHAPVETALRGLAMLGAIALVAIVVGMFLPSLITLAFAAGLVGGAGLYVLKPTLMVQALALFVAIAAPTAAVILLVRRLRIMRDGAHTGGTGGAASRAGADRRGNSGADAGYSTNAIAGDSSDANTSNTAPADAGIQMSAGKRLGSALLLYLRTALLSVAAVPLVVAMLNHISYSLVLQQFRGVSLLHAAPIGLVAIYVFLYGSGESVIANTRKLLTTPVTVLWIAVIGVLGAAGLYYMTRTGNSGSVSGIELTFRSLLENTFGVRPRTKEFLIGHPLMLAGIFLALRYRFAAGLIVLGTVGQLSLVDTFAHIHTPLILSITRVLLGLGIGLLIGLAAIAVWQIAERVWRRLELREAK